MRRLLLVALATVVWGCGTGASEPVAPPGSTDVPPNVTTTADDTPTTGRTPPPTSVATETTVGTTTTPVVTTIAATTTTTTTTTATSTPRTTAPDVEPPELVVTRPADGAVVTSRTLRFEGRTEPGALVTAWDRWPAEVDPEGNWSIVLVLEPGDNLARFRAVDAAGNTTDVAIHVTLRTWTADVGDPTYRVATPPCCADNFHGDASPAFPPPGEPLADGPYTFSAWTSWPSGLATQSLELEVLRFEPCSSQPDRCAPLPSGAEDAATDLFVDDTESRALTLEPGDFSVVIFGCGEVLGGSAADLADLVAEVDHAFATTFTDPLAHGADPDSILAEVRADQTGGFHPSEDVWPMVPGHYVFVSAHGPMIFFQFIPEYLDGAPVYARGSDAMWAYGFEVVQGRVTLHVGSWFVP